MIVFKRARMALYFLLLFYSMMGCESMICLYQALAVPAGLLSLNEGALVRKPHFIFNYMAAGKFLKGSFGLCKARFSCFNRFELHN